MTERCLYAAQKTCFVIINTKQMGVHFVFLFLINYVIFICNTVLSFNLTEGVCVSLRVR